MPDLGIGFQKFETRQRPADGPTASKPQLESWTSNNRAKRRKTDRPKDYEGSMYIAVSIFFAAVILILAGFWA